MKKYNITVNGTSYEVEVEELGSQASAPVAKEVPKAAPAPKAEPAPAPKAEPAPAPTAKPTPGANSITCPMPGTILDIKVSAGQSFSKGDVLLILEAMKMENEIMAPEDGKVTSVITTKGASVNSGDVLLEIE